MRFFSYLLLSIFSLLATHCYAENNIKLLVLVIANDQDPIYVSLQKIWKSYMHLDPHVDAYFVKADPGLPVAYRIEGDTIWAKTQESIFPGILNKTLLSLEAMQSKLDTYDYTLRTNLSSFYSFPRLLSALKNAAKKNFCYSFGIPHLQPIVISGAGYILSQDVVKMVLENKNHFMNVREYDDLTLGAFLLKRGIPLLRHERIDLLTLRDYVNNKHKIIHSNCFQFRIKNPNNKLRLRDDLFIHSELLKIFYNITL